MRFATAKTSLEKNRRGSQIAMLSMVFATTGTLRVINVENFDKTVYYMPKLLITHSSKASLSSLCLSSIGNNSRTQVTDMFET